MMTGLGVWDVIAFVGTAGFTTALVTQIILILRDRFENRKSAATLAIRCAAILETYSHECLDVAADYDARVAQGHDAGTMSIDVPAFPDYPNDAGAWSALPIGISGKLINLRLAVADRLRALSYNTGYETPDIASSEYRDANILVAADAWFVASELRRLYKFPEYGKIDANAPQTSTAYYLEHAVNEIEAKRLTREKEHASTIVSL